MFAPGLRFDGGEHTFFSALGEPLPNFIIARRRYKALDGREWCAAKRSQIIIFQISRTWNCLILIVEVWTEDRRVYF